MTARDRGAADALGLALMAPVAIGLALLVGLLGRHVDGRAQVRTAAESAAQAAALERSAAAADLAARRVAVAMLDGACAAARVTVALGDFRPGGTVGVSVSCTIEADGLELVAPAPQVVSAAATAAVDRFRDGEVRP